MPTRERKQQASRTWKESQDKMLRAPFPWFGGKSRVADLVWDRFAVKMLRTLKLNTGKLTAAPLFAVALMDNESEPEESDFFGMPGKNAEDAVREAQEHFEGGDVAHVLTPDGGGTKILLT